MQLARKIPSVLWPCWSLPFLVPGCHHRQLRQVLSVGLLVVGAPIGLSRAARLLRSPINGQGVSRILQLLQNHPDWDRINLAVVALADQLKDLEVPIDYRRRRTLDYRTLLPDEVWFRICRETDTAAQGSARGAAVRYYLRERLSGSIAQDDSVTPALRAKIADFPHYLTPELSDALDNHAVEFLAGQGVHDEPVQYQPPPGDLRGLRLPGAYPDNADVYTLHAGAQAGFSLGQSADLAGVELEVARYLLTCYPTPVLPDVECGAYYRAKRAYPRQRFIDHYQVQAMSLRDLAGEAGVSRQTMMRLAKDYKIDLRKPGRSTKHTIERDWLYTEYVLNGRPLPDLARQQGVSTSTMARWANVYAIPLRPRGGTRKRASGRRG